MKSIIQSYNPNLLSKHTNPVTACSCIAVKNQNAC